MVQVEARRSAVRWSSGFDCIGQVFSRSLVAPGVAVGFVTLLLAGLILGAAFARTRALYLSIGLHAGWVFTLKAYGVLTTAQAAEATRWWGGGSLTENVLTWPVLVVVFFVVAAISRRGPAAAET